MGLCCRRLRSKPPLPREGALRAHRRLLGVSPPAASRSRTRRARRRRCCFTPSPSSVPPSLRRPDDLALLLHLGPALWVGAAASASASPPRSRGARDDGERRRLAPSTRCSASPLPPAPPPSRPPPASPRPRRPPPSVRRHAADRLRDLAAQLALVGALAAARRPRRRDAAHHALQRFTFGSSPAKLSRGPSRWRPAAARESAPLDYPGHSTWASGAGPCRSRNRAGLSWIEL